MKITSSVLSLVLVVRLNALPRYGISPSSGTLLTCVLSVFCINPPMTTVVWSGVTTTVSAEVLLMTGALKFCEICTDCVESELISGETIISMFRLAVMNGVTRRMMPTSVILHAGAVCPRVADDVAAGQRHRLADEDGRLLVVAREDGRAREHGNLALLRQRVERGGGVPRVEPEETRRWSALDRPKLVDGPAVPRVVPVTGRLLVRGGRGRAVGAGRGADGRGRLRGRRARRSPVDGRRR